MQYRKDCLPIDTVNRIRLLLKKNKLKVREKYFSLEDAFFRIELN